MVPQATVLPAPPERKRAMSNLDRGRTGFGYLLLTPQIVGFTFVGVGALIWVIWLSLNKVNVLSGSQEFVGLENYIRITNDPSMATVLPNTLFFVSVLSVSGTVVALLLAVMLNQKLPGITFFRSAIFLPALVTMVAWALVWSFIVQPQGLLDTITGALGASPFPWLRSEWATLTVFAVIQLLKNVGINVMIFLAALQAVPQELVDAARVDGARAWGTFRHVVIPQISPSIMMVFMLMIVGSFKVFELVLLLTDGGPGVQTSVLSFEIYRQAFRLNEIGYASALAVLLFAIVLALTAVVWQLRKRLVFHEND